MSYGASGFGWHSKGQHLPLAALAAGHPVGRQQPRAACERIWSKLFLVYYMPLSRAWSTVVHTVVPYCHVFIFNFSMYLVSFGNNCVWGDRRSPERLTAMHRDHVHTVSCLHWFPASPVKLVGLGDTIFLNGETKPDCFSVASYVPERQQPWPTGLHRSWAQQEPISPAKVLSYTYASTFAKGSVITYPHSFTSNTVSEKNLIILAKHLYPNR